MDIHFDDVIPAPLAGILDSKTHTETPSEIWQKNLKFEKQKKYQVYAPSGKGKSTFIHIIYGLRNDYEGNVLLDTQNVRNISLNAWAKLRQEKVAVVFQDLRLFEELTALENIQAKTALYSEDYQAKIEEMSAFLGVTHLLGNKTTRLSYGERQRIAIIRALIQPFSLLLLDEPFSHLDESNIQKACTLIDQKCKENQAGLIMTSLGYPYFIEFDQRLIL